MGRRRKSEGDRRAETRLVASSGSDPSGRAGAADSDRTSPRRFRIFLGVVLGLVFVAGAALGYRQIASPDIGFHLATARWIVENGSWPRTDPLSYTVPDHPYIDLQWLFQLLTYGLIEIGGTAAVTAATTCLTLLFAALLLLRSRLRRGSLPLSVTALLPLFFLANHWEPRPHLLSWIWGSLLLLLLERNDRGSRRWLPFLPLIMIAWVNSHSLFVLGIVILGTYCAGDLVCRSRQKDKTLLAWSAIAVAACLVNPYHVRGLLFPLVQLRDIQGVAGFKSPLTGIAEFTSPFGFAEYFSEGRFVLFQPRLFWQLFTALAVAGWIADRKKVRPVEWVLFLGFLYVFWRANKNFGYFVLVAFPAAAAGLDRIGRGIRSAFAAGKKSAAESMASDRWKAAWLGGCAVACVAWIAAVGTGWLYSVAWSPHRPGTGFNSSILPVEACRFLERNGIEGRLLNTWNQGGYIAWATGRNVFVYSHGEVMGPAFYREYVEAKQPDGFPEALRKWKPTVAVVPFDRASFWLYHLDRSDEWRMVHADDHTAVFLHESVAPEVAALPRPRAGIDYPPFDDANLERTIRQAAGARAPSLPEWLQGSRAYPRREMTLSAFYLHTAEIDAAIGVSLAGVEQTPFLVPELMLNLGHALNARRRYAIADVCFDAFLRADRDPVIAREIESARRSRR
jgi:hypothetical protein